MKKIIHEKYVIPIYNTYLNIVYSKDFDIDEILYELKDNILETSDEDAFNDIITSGVDANGLAFYTDSEYYIILEANIDIGIIAHECKHILNYIFKFVNIKLDEAEDEAECYFLEYLVNLVYSFCLKNKIKLNNNKFIYNPPIKELNKIIE